MKKQTNKQTSLCRCNRVKGCAGGPAHHHECPDKQEMQHQREALRGQRQRLGNEATGSWRQEGPGASRGSPALHPGAQASSRTLAPAVAGRSHFFWTLPDPQDIPGTIPFEMRRSPGAWSPGCLWAEQDSGLNPILMTAPLLTGGNQGRE